MESRSSFLPVEADEPRIETGAVLLHLGDDRPVFVGLENLDLAFALADQAQGDRLHAACRFRAGKLAPQHGRKGEAEQVIQRAAAR